jgi:hypothetical protein
MTARHYRLVANLNEKQNLYVAGLKGQARVVMNELANNKEPRLGVDIDKECGPKFVTKQDTLRVTLYYIIIFKNKGVVEAVETRTDENAFAGIAELSE